MRDNLTYIILLLDKSGSMERVQDATIEGTNSYIQKQRQQPGEAVLHVVQFDHVIEISHNYVDLKSATLLSHMNYQPRGSTALLDAIGSTIDSVGNTLANMVESERPGKVIFVVQTDGDENASVFYSRHIDGYTRIAEKIKHQTEVYKWDFVFLGANQDAIATASNLGIKGGKALTYTSTSVGTRTAFDTLGGYTMSVRSLSPEAMAKGGLEAVCFSDADRKANKGGN